jgi:hypothetical protein
MSIYTVSTVRLLASTPDLALATVITCSLYLGLVGFGRFLGFILREIVLIVASSQPGDGYFRPLVGHWSAIELH